MTSTYEKSKVKIMSTVTKLKNQILGKQRMKIANL